MRICLTYKYLEECIGIAPTDMKLDAERIIQMKALSDMLPMTDFVKKILNNM
jgi:hypothetical protein